VKANKFLVPLTKKHIEISCIHPLMYCKCEVRKALINIYICYILSW